MILSPNIEPQSMIGFSSGAPTTFSMTYGLPVAFSAARVAAIRSGYSRPQRPWSDVWA
jgi:hypothetical protein